MRRVVSVWLPRFATDRLRRQRRRTGASSPRASRSESPLATVTAAHGGVRVVAVNGAAAAAGLAPGMALADARALAPGLTVAEADPIADAEALAALAEWCGRYTPWTAVDADGASGGFGGGRGLWLDVTGCAHLCGGERALAADLVGRLADFGIEAVAAIADTPGAAWATARFAAGDAPRPGPTDPGIPPRHPRHERQFVKPRPPHVEAGAGDAVRVVAAGAAEAALRPLPVAALRLAPAAVEGLGRVGLRRIADIIDVPRAPLAARFGEAVPRRLDQALGRADEPLSPRRPVPAMRARLAFAEPIGRADDIRRAARVLLDDLAARLAAARLGARRLELWLYRADGTVAGAAIGTSRPARDPGHLERLFREKIERLDPGFGVEVMVLAAAVAEPLAPTQDAFADGGTDGETVARLVDRLAGRLGPANVVRLEAHASHVPERACREAPVLAPAPPAAEGPERPRLPRPVELLPAPEPIEVVAPVPDGPPAMFRWRRAQHRVSAAEGPERIGAEWWREDGGHDPERQARMRDYYRVEDAQGRRFWLYREGLYRPDRPPRWYLHGVFA